jgi:predicted transcriptional regulator
MTKNEEVNNMATITATELAAEIGTTPREVRKFLRADAKAHDAQTPGKGSRYAIDRKQVRSLKARYAKWDEARKAAEAEKSAEAPESDD